MRCLGLSCPPPPHAASIALCETPWLYAITRKVPLAVALSEHLIHALKPRLRAPHCCSTTYFPTLPYRVIQTFPVPLPRIATWATSARSRLDEPLYCQRWLVPLEGPREGVLGAHQRKAAVQERGLFGNGTINGYGSVEPSTIA